MHKFLTSGNRRYALALVIVGACLAVMGAQCQPTAPPVPHEEWYYTDIQVQPSSPSGTYGFNTVCELEGGGTFTHPDTITHVTGSLTRQSFNWSLGTTSNGGTAPTPASEPESCFVQETAGPSGTTPSYWLTHPVPAPFGTPPIYEPITAPTSTPQTCHFSFSGTYEDRNPPLDVWDCWFAVTNA